MALGVPCYGSGVVGDGGLVGEGSESCCRGPGDVVAAVAGGVDNVYGGREGEDAFFEGSGWLVIPVVEGCGMRDGVQLFRF